jgi:hypothetical protein
MARCFYSILRQVRPNGAPRRRNIKSQSMGEANGTTLLHPATRQFLQVPVTSKVPTLAAEHQSKVIEPPPWGATALCVQ